MINNVSGNEKKWEAIRKKLLSGKHPHAFLFSGPNGIGKFEEAKKIAQQILGEKLFNPGNCVIVDRLYTEGNDNDLQALSSSSWFDQSHRKQSKKKTDKIGVDDLAVFTRFLYDTTDSPKKILLIKNIERMGIEASNKFLKVLEEPPAKTLFLLTTSSHQKLLPTIVSRTQIEKFSFNTPQEILMEIDATYQDLSSEQKETILYISSGRKIKALQLANNPDDLISEQDFFNELSLIIEDSPSKKFSLAETWSKNSVPDIEKIFSAYEIIFRDKLRKSLLEKNKNPHLWEKRVILLRESKKKIKKNVNKRLVLENFLLGL